MRNVLSRVQSTSRLVHSLVASRTIKPHGRASLYTPLTRPILNARTEDQEALLLSRTVLQHDISGAVFADRLQVIVQNLTDYTSVVPRPKGQGLLHTRLDDAKYRTGSSAHDVRKNLTNTPQRQRWPTTRSTPVRDMDRVRIPYSSDYRRYACVTPYYR
ncbi:hypothetical protein C8Q74DRAFT_1214032 [Fomes fomentarius]|nr:hypothetical protein C8Q74DRAFT_1214032 [Fomes fomentarius]